jgi:NAD-dependent deacetylase
VSVAVLHERLAAARRVTVLTGAGVSAASGVPTFRGSDGLWQQHRAADLATPEAFARDRTLVWEWYQWRRSMIAACQPNVTHHVLAMWAERRGAHVITQNVDDLHLRAGTPDLIRLHGSIWELSCWRGCPSGLQPWRDERVPIPATELVCRHCSGPARPAVVWFGEPLSPEDIRRAAAASSCDVFIAAGTSSVVYPAAGFIDLARRSGAFTVEINPEKTEASRRVHLAIQAPAEQVFGELE